MPMDCRSKLSRKPRQILQRPIANLAPIPIHPVLNNHPKRIVKGLFKSPEIGRAIPSRFLRGRLVPSLATPPPKKKIA
jgi:hypothetical protein